MKKLLTIILVLVGLNGFAQFQYLGTKENTVWVRNVLVVDSGFRFPRDTIARSNSDTGRSAIKNGVLYIYTKTGSVYKWNPVQGIAVSSVETASNVGTGLGVFKAKVSTDLQFKSITNSWGITLTSNINDVNVKTDSSVVASVWDVTDNRRQLLDTINKVDTLRFKNIGSLGEGVFREVSGDTAKFKKIAGTQPIVVTQSDSTVSLSFAWTVYTLATTNATPTTIAIIPTGGGSLAESGFYDMQIHANNFAAGGTDVINGTVRVNYKNPASTTVTIVSTSGSLTGTGVLAGATASFAGSGANIICSVTGIAATNIGWQLTAEQRQKKIL